MAIWKFQLLPHQPDVVRPGYRMDAVGTSLEREVNSALPYRFRFHKISKIVLVLSHGTLHEQDYTEQLGVATKVIPDFSLRDYVKSTSQRKIETLKSAISSEFAWFEENFEDAQFIHNARRKLGWDA